MAICWDPDIIVKRIFIFKSNSFQLNAEIQGLVLNYNEIFSGKIQKERKKIRQLSMWPLIHLFSDPPFEVHFLHKPNYIFK